MSSPTFGDGLQRALRYQKIFTDAFVAHLHIENQNAMITNSSAPSSSLSRMCHKRYA